jgi:hypothetical protein
LLLACLVDHLLEITLSLKTLQKRFQVVRLSSSDRGRDNELSRLATKTLMEVMEKLALAG